MDITETSPITVSCPCGMRHTSEARFDGVPVIRCPFAERGSSRLVDTRYLLFDEGEGRGFERVYPDYDGKLWIVGKG